MFYHTSGLRTILQIHPTHMGMLIGNDKVNLNNNDLLKKELIEKVEGKKSNEHGYIILVVNLRYMSKPLIDYDGFIKVEIQFDALTFKPQLKEYIDIQITEIKQNHIAGSVGPMNIFYVPNRKLPQQLQNELKDGKLESDDLTLYEGDKLRVLIETINNDKILCKVDDDFNSYQ
ncbi:RNA polymerase Rpb7, amine-terminal domain protein (macronuclear) [Tetrahymena thermophila SB210]|uniref:RNA polymerase Rpb7, amine-terminal domain protein n=1 Tax=Tetrahymena thermophila (strain SB210) TaxID=312017 RepID=I7LWZ3_TETTS|nr:RNA polymerase Rpb7, amine-terminal domain protein [Tetrahymena thermophila SB210]EAS03135.2 RNA polymerase Rpb7, amine-terminal domain protein [Tetrahymena thermophila SB210]|eukprot:XP_001023380.2 RNA polymerase Rpb7, amine-terminal domain protein [Tetrahymena thermophila SB210]